jgi:amino acid transporter
MSEPVKPPRTVGAVGTSLFQVNGMIGSGIFALPAVLVAAVGSFAPMMIVFGFALILPLGLVFAWLAGRFDSTGGPVLYGKTAFGSFAGFQAGWGRYASGMVSLAANTHVMVSYFAALFPVLESGFAAGVTVFATIVILTIINTLGMRSSVNALGFMTVLKLAPLGILVLAAAFGNYNAPAIVLPEFSQAETVILLTFYAFIGFEGVTVPAGEMKDPKRDLPRVLIATLAGVTLIYVAVIWAYMAIATEPTGNTNALAGAGEIAFGQFGAFMIVIAAGFSIMANNFTSVIVVPRMAFGMAEQGMLPQWFAQISPRFLTPANSILFYGFSSALLSLTGGFAALAAASTLTRLLTYVISAAALPAIERREGAINPLHGIVALLALASCGWLATHATANSWATFGGLLVIGTGLYFIARRRNGQGVPETA